MPGGRVSELLRVPVKSMQGERVDTLAVGPGGVAGDRRWAVVHGHRALSAKVEPRLLAASARLDGDDVVVTLPTGEELVAGDPAADAAIASWLGRPVRLERASPGMQRTFRMPDDPLDPRSPVSEYPCPPGTFLDVAHVHLLTTASLAAAAALDPRASWDKRRFRPTVLVEDAGEGWVEDGWTGRAVRLGTAVVGVFMPTGRCAMVAKGQPGLAADPRPVRALARHHGFTIGVYADVVTPGVVAVGDDVTVSVAAGAAT